MKTKQNNSLVDDKQTDCYNHKTNTYDEIFLKFLLSAQYLIFSAQQSSEELDVSNNINIRRRALTHFHTPVIIFLSQ